MLYISHVIQIQTSYGWLQTLEITLAGSQCLVPFPGSDWLWVYEHGPLLVGLFVSWAGHLWARKGQTGVQSWWLNYFRFKVGLYWHTVQFVGSQDLQWDGGKNCTSCFSVSWFCAS